MNFLEEFKKNFLAESGNSSHLKIDLRHYKSSKEIKNELRDCNLEGQM